MYSKSFICSDCIDKYVVYFSRKLTNIEERIYINMQNTIDITKYNNLKYITICFVNQLNNCDAVKYMDLFDICEYLKQISDCFNYYSMLMIEEQDPKKKQIHKEHIDYYITHFKMYPDEFNFKFEPIECEFTTLQI